MASARGDLLVKVLVCGSRSWNRRDVILARLRRLPPEATVIHGAAYGADSLAASAAADLGLRVEAYPANWHGRGYYDPRAGLKRNILMLDQQPDLVIAFHRENSTGTNHTILEARKREIPVEVIHYDARPA